MEFFKRTVKKCLLMTVILTISVISATVSFAGSVPMSDNHLYVGDSIVKRIMPKPESDSMYVATDYTEIHFELNKAILDISYMDNGLSLLHLDRVIDSIGIENITAIEIVSQSSPEGPLERNTWLTENRSKVMKEYMYRVFPELKPIISVNKVIESWDNLARYVAQDPNLGEDTKDKILDIIDSDQISIAKKKTMLKNSLGSDPKVGNVYAYLYKYYYPVIRNSGIYILHMVEPQTAFNMDIEKPHVDETTTNPQGTIDYQPGEQSRPKEPVRKRPFIAVKTNLAYDAFFTKDMSWAPIYNIEAELYLTENGRWTILGEYEFPWHSIPSRHQYLQILNLQFEGRRYFKKDSHHTGHYLSAYAGINLYDICFDRRGGHGYQGEGFGGGLGYGYVLPLGKKPNTRWKLEFFVKGGLYMTFYDAYDAGSPFAGKYYYDWIEDPNLFIKRNNIFRWLGPTGGGISISYDLIRKKVKDK